MCSIRSFRRIASPLACQYHHRSYWPTSRCTAAFSTAKMDKRMVEGKTYTPESKEELDSDKHAWKKRAPYRILEPNEKFDARYEASCHCGRVKYELKREVPVDSKLCHCTTCQVQHAAPFQWAAIFHKDDISFERGHHDLEWYDPTEKSIEHKLPCKVRCSFCHSPIMDEGRNMILLFPSLIKFKSEKDKENFKPRLHMFYGERVIDIPDGLPKWTGLNDVSDLIEDSPPDMVRDRARAKTQEKKDEAHEKNQQVQKDYENQE